MIDMIDEPTCCEPRFDTFLAITKVKPLEPEKPEKTEIEKEEIEKEIVECLNYPILWNDPSPLDNEVVEEISILEKLNRVNLHLNSLYKNKENLENNSNNKENLQKINREIRCFLSKKENLLYHYQKEIDGEEEKKEINDQCEDIKKIIENLFQENLIHRLMKTRNE